MMRKRLFPEDCLHSLARPIMTEKGDGTKPYGNSLRVAVGDFMLELLIVSIIVFNLREFGVVSAVRNKTEKPKILWNDLLKTFSD